MVFGDVWYSGSQMKNDIPGRNSVKDVLISEEMCL